MTTIPPIHVLDHGYVTLIDHMGTEETIIAAARMSTGKGFLGWEPNGTPEHKGDARLLEHLYANNHHTPFEMCELALEVQAPIFVVREWMRHRTCSFNEMSARYVQMPNLHYVPAIERVQKQATKNKQGSGEAVSGDDAIRFRNRIINGQDEIYERYEEDISEGIALELARINTTVSRYTRMRAKANLRNWLGFLTLRTHASAQFEIRVYADAIAAIIEELWPRTYALWVEHTRDAVKLSASEVAEIRTQVLCISETTSKKLGLV